MVHEETVLSQTRYPLFENEKSRLRLVFSDYNGAEPEGDNMNPSIILVDWFVFFAMVYVHKAKTNFTTRRNTVW